MLYNEVNYYTACVIKEVYMRNKKLLFFSISLIIILLASLMVTVAFASDKITLTPETVTENYVQFTNPTLMAKSDTLMAVLDGGVIRVFDNDNTELGQINIGQINSSADNMVIMGDSIYIATNYKLNRYKIASGRVLEPTKVTENNIYSLFADKTNVYYVAINNNALYRYDGNVTTEIPLSDTAKGDYIVGYQLAACDGVVYSYKNGNMSIVSNSAWNTIATGESKISKFYVLDGIPITLSENHLTISKGDKSIVSETPLDLYVHGDKIFVLDTTDKSVTEYDKDLNKVSKIGSLGSETNRLNSPNAIASGDSKLFIADNGNNRVSIYSTLNGEYSIVPVSHAVDKIVATANGFATYSRANNKIYIYTLNKNEYTLTQEVTTDSELYDIASWNNAILGLKSDGNVFNYSSPNDTVSLHGATNLYINYKTNVLYIASPTRLTRKNLLTGTEQNFSHSESFTDFTVDYGGNIYFLSNGLIRRFTAGGNILQLSNEYTVTGINSDFSATLSSLGDIYFADKNAHKISKINASDIGAVSDKTYTPPTESEYSIIKGITLEVGAGLYTSPGNEETLITLSKNTRFLALASITHKNNEYYYGFNYSDSEYYYVLKSSVSLLNCTDYDADYPKYSALIATGLKVYAFPYNSATVTATIDNSVRLALINNVADSTGESWGWYKVSYVVDGETHFGYVHDYEIAKVSAVEPPQKSQFYKVNSGALGTVVKFYKEASEDSEQICDINDGASVLVVGTFDKNQEYTYIYFNGNYGYIETQYLILEGLTTVQITAIIVVSICVVALLVTIPLFIMLYKRSKRPSSDDKAVQ